MAFQPSSGQLSCQSHDPDAGCDGDDFALAFSDSQRCAGDSTSSLGNVMLLGVSATSPLQPGTYTYSSTSGVGPIISGDLNFGSLEGGSVTFSEFDLSPPRVVGSFDLYFRDEDAGVSQVQGSTAFLQSAYPNGNALFTAVHCESGLGRSAFMGASYWVANGLTAETAIRKVRQALQNAGCDTDEWLTGERKKLLREYEQSQLDSPS